MLYLYGNYGGDVMNFDLAAELAGAEGIEVAHRARRRRRRLGAARARRAPPRHRGDLLPVQGRRRRGRARAASLEEVERGDATARPPNAAAWAWRSRPARCPPAGVPTFELPDGQMEIGMGIHGEPGVRRGPLETADADRRRS